MISGRQYNYVSTAHKPTAVTHALTGHFTEKDVLNLIIGYVLDSNAFHIYDEP